MRTLGPFKLVLLLLFATGCADESLVEVAEKDVPIKAERAVPARLGMMEAASIYGMEPVAAMAESDRVLLMGEGSFSEVANTGEIIRCRDTEGNRVVGLFVFAGATITGRFFFLDDMTGFFTRDRCVLDGDELALEGSWTFSAADTGESIWGSYTAVFSLADGSFTHHETIEDGTGRFAGATGWIRGIGTFPPVSGDGMFYGKGLITRPREVTTRGFVLDAVSESSEGELPCLNPEGGPSTLTAFAQTNLEGAATYLGPLTGALVHDHCMDEFRGGVTLSGTWMLTGLDGTVLQGTHVLNLSGRPRSSIEMIITSGTGALEQASGWVGGFAQLRPDGSAGFPLEGLIFLPR